MAGSFVMQTPIASCLIQMSALSLSPLLHSRSTPTPLHPPALTPPPPLPSPLSLCRALLLKSKQILAERRGSLQAQGCWGRPLSWGSASVSAHGAVSSPNQVHFIFKCYNQASDPQGALYGCGPRSQGQDGDLIAEAEERRGGAKVI